MTDWDDLRVFLAVARAESLSAAGRVLRLDPATVGRRVARLEEAMAARLFARSAQGYALTEEGQRLLAHAIRAEQAVAAAGEEVRGDPGRLSGQVRIGAPDGVANFLLPQVTARICDHNPGLEVQIIALPRVFNLSKREADMAIAVSRPATGRMTVQKLVDYHLSLAASADYLARSPTIGSLADLSQHRIVGYIPDMIFDKELDYLSQLGVDHAALASNSVFSITTEHSTPLSAMSPHAAAWRDRLARSIKYRKIFFIAARVWPSPEASPGNNLHPADYSSSFPVHKNIVSSLPDRLHPGISES